MSAPHALRGSLVGHTLGRYRVEEQIGAGGMGVVYRAIDTSLGRSVAIKVLPEHCARDAERRSRFEREARLLAALNHKNIAAIHGLETHGEFCFLALEFVPGETLEERLAREAPDLAEALRIVRQLAEALEAAHDRGIIHRDLKPANVKITPRGEVKVLDFGLAKALDVLAAGPDAPTAMLDETESGVILGTAAYMSPEQARGKPVDKRTDVWSFGCVLYEMLTRRRAFAGQTASDCIAAILGKDPEWTAIPDATPKTVVKLLKRCLEKDPQQRLRDIGDARLELDDALAGPEEAAPVVRPRLRIAAITVALVVIAATAVAGVLLVGRTAPAPPVTRFAIPMAPDEVVGPIGNSVRLSADGRQLAWATVNTHGRTVIYSRQFDDFDGKALPGTAGGISPFFSPDGKWIGFWHTASRTLKKLALSGGAPAVIAPYESGAFASWSASGDLFAAISHPGALVRIPAGGGKPIAVTALDTARGDRLHTRGALLPGGKAILFVITGAGMETHDDARIAVHSLETGRHKVLIEGGMSPFYSLTGHIVYAREGKLHAVPFDVERLEVTGPPVAVVSGVFTCTITGAAHFSLAENGTLAYAPGIVLGGRRQLVWVDREGKFEALSAPERAYLHPRLSPDDRRLAVEIEGPVHDFWTYEFERGVMSKVTLEGLSHWPLWTPDGSRLTFRRWVNGAFTMWSIPADRSTPAQRLTEVGRMQSPGSWTPDGRIVAFTQVSFDTGADVFVMDMADRMPRALVQTQFSEGAPRFSPDGHYLAYTSNESGRNEIYVQAYPGPGPKVQVSTEGGSDVVWKRRGGELYYRDGDRMMAVEISTSGAFRASRPKVLWTGEYAHGLGSMCGPPGTTSSNYDVTADGQRFLMIRHQEEAPRRINVVVNWTEELKRAMQ